MGKFKNGLLVTVSGAFAIGSLLLGTTYYNSNVKAEQKPKKEIKVIKKEIPKKEVPKKETIEKKKDNRVSKLFLNSKNIFLAKDVTIESIEDLEKKSNELSNEDVKLLNEAKIKWDIQNNLNSLYETPVLKGDKYDEEANVKEGLTPVKLEKLNNKIIKLKDDAFKEKVVEIRMYLEGFIGYSIGSTDESKEANETVSTETEIISNEVTELQQPQESESQLEQAGVSQHGELAVESESTENPGIENNNY